MSNNLDPGSAKKSVSEEFMKTQQATAFWSMANLLEASFSLTSQEGTFMYTSPSKMRDGAAENTSNLSLNTLSYTAEFPEFQPLRRSQTQKQQKSWQLGEANKKDCSESISQTTTTQSSGVSLKKNAGS